MTHSSVLSCLDSRTLTWWTIPGTHLRPGTRPSSCALFSSNVFTEDINKSTSHLSKKKKAFFQMLGWSFVTCYEEPSVFYKLLIQIFYILLDSSVTSSLLHLAHGTLHLWLKLYVSLYFFTSLISNSLALLFCLVCLFLVCMYKPWLLSYVVHSSWLFTILTHWLFYEYPFHHVFSFSKQHRDNVVTKERQAPFLMKLSG